MYNHEKYLKYALDGFVNQITNFDYEVFVHDDASTDLSASIIMDYAEKYPNIIKPIIQTENQFSRGTDIFMNIIRPLMNGDYIASCEGDDYWIDNRKLQKQVDFLDAHPEYVACVHNTKKIDLWKKKEYIMYKHDVDEDIKVEDVLADGSSAYHTSSLMYRKEYAELRPDFMEVKRGFRDYPMAIYLFLSGKIRFLADVMSAYRFGAENSWTSRTQTDFKKIDIAIQNKIDLLNEVNQYSNYIYDKQIQKAILMHEYARKEMAGEYSKLRYAPFASIYNEKPLNYKVKLILKQLFNKSYRMLRKRYYNRTSRKA